MSCLVRQLVAIMPTTSLFHCPSARLPRIRDEEAARREGEGCDGRGATACGGMNVSPRGDPEPGTRSSTGESRREGQGQVST